jgi:hypothetical protein
MGHLAAASLRAGLIAGAMGGEVPDAAALFGIVTAAASADPDDARAAYLAMCERRGWPTTPATC